MKQEMKAKTFGIVYHIPETPAKRKKLILVVFSKSQSSIPIYSQIADLSFNSRELGSVEASKYDAAGPNSTKKLLESSIKSKITSKAWCWE